MLLCPDLAKAVLSHLFHAALVRRKWDNIGACPYLSVWHWKGLYWLSAEVPMFHFLIPWTRFTSPQTFPNSLYSSHHHLPLILPLGPEVLPLRWTQDVDFQWTWCLREGMWRSLSCGFLLQALLEPCRLVKLHVKCLAQGHGQRKQSSSAPGHICLPRSPSFLIPQTPPLPASTLGPSMDAPHGSQT